MKSVYLYTGGIHKAHPVYQESSRYAPDGFFYTPSAEVFFGVKKTDGHPPSKLSRLTARLSHFALAALVKCRVPKVRLIRLPTGTILVHSGQYPLLNYIPWVVDFEQVASFAWFDRNVLDSKTTKHYFEKLFASAYCRALIGWTSAAKQSLLNAFDCSKFKQKIHAVPFAIIPQEYVNRLERRGAIELFFCSGNFYYKGGLGAILTTIELAKHYDVHLTVVSNLPLEIVQAYSRNIHITLLNGVNAAQRHQLMRSADIFIHPAHSETYGYVMLEAFSFGLPVITTDGFSGPELVGESARGYAVKNYLSWFDDKLLPWVKTKQEASKFYEDLRHPPQDYIERLARAIARLIEQRELRLQMGDRAFQSVIEGIFSPQRRQEQLGQIYSSALLNN